LNAARAAVAESSALYGSEGQRSRASIVQAAARIEILAGDLGAAADYAIQVLNLASTLGDAPLLRAAFTDAGAILELAGHHSEASYALGAGRAEILCSRPVTRMSAPACNARDRVIAVLGNARYRSHYRNGAIAPTKEAVFTTIHALEEFLAAPDPPRPKDPPATGADLGLTARELDVLHELARGRSNVEIAAQLYITQETVKSHVRKILRKLGVSSRSAAVGVAFRAGIVGKDGPGTA
jgi:DNA-binding CsgD family transcriptional regulator